MNFGARLAEERKRLGLRQAEFAERVGTDVPKQSLYETGKRELRAEYLAKLVEADVDVVYVLTGRRSEGSWAGEEASALLSAYLRLPHEMQRALLDLVETMRAQFAPPAGSTLHSGRLGYRADDTPR
ncbi:MAG TPA: helix-turn-helix transcriptional regulator [Allosphingosinicella sp.]|uniref:helix-turn-helix domain-containing protein n=1 Tax=Allosphingosinicella sp. TaxID=2823234 RepID=UPI002EDBA865